MIRALAPTTAIKPLESTTSQPMVRSRDETGELATHIQLTEQRLRSEAAREERAAKGQFFTPWAVAKRMAAMVGNLPVLVRLLDPGAGFGTLAAAMMLEICRRNGPTRHVEIVAVELDSRCHPALAQTLRLLERTGAAFGIRVQATLEKGNFLELGHRWSGAQLLFERRGFDLVIANPPFQKIRSDSRERAWLRAADIETSNLYSGFLAMAVELLEPNGELVAISPRSFCNGPYFLPFRRILTKRGHFQRIHLFQDRKRTFEQDRVLQENLIFSFLRKAKPSNVLVSTSIDGNSPDISRHELPAHELIDLTDPNLFIHLPTSPEQRRFATAMAKLEGRLVDLDLEVSTGRVVEFRCRSFLTREAQEEAVPLLFPSHLSQGRVQWPLPGIDRPQFLRVSPESSPLLVPAGTYVLTRRLTAKEERRRIVPALLDAPGPVAIENHLNVFHRQGRGLPSTLARGLFLYLSSSLVEGYFRQFNGHTQVNATDLRSLRYPSAGQLERLGATCEAGADQPMIDEILSRTLAE